MTETTLLLEKIRTLVQAQRGEGVAVSAWASRELADAVYELDQLLSGDGMAPLPDQWNITSPVPMPETTGFHAFLGGMAGSFLGTLVREGPQPVPTKPPRFLTTRMSEIAAKPPKKRRKR